MAYVLRFVKKANWFRESAAQDSQLQDAPADTLGDLRTTGNELSFWLVDEAKSNLGRLLGSFAAARARIDNLDFALFSDEVLAQANITVYKTPGDLRDSTANEWHLAAINLTATHVADLANLVWQSPTTEIERYLAKQVAQLVASAVERNHVPREQLSQEIRENIRKLLGLTYE